MWVNATLEHPSHHVTEPLVFDEPVDVTLADARLVAAWICYQSMMQWLYAPMAFSGFPSDDFRVLRETGAPPAAHAMWIGRLDPALLKLKATGPVVPWGYAPDVPGVVSVVGRLVVVHLVRPSTEGALWHEGEDAGALVRLWPDPAPFRWPPPVSLELDGYQRVKQGLHPEGGPEVRG